MANLGAALAQQGRLADAIDWTERAWRSGNLTAGFKPRHLLQPGRATATGPTSFGPRPPNWVTRMR